MAVSDDVVQFVREALGRGASRDQIRQALRDAGWSAREVDDALQAFADVPFPVPVPRPQTNTDARETFLYGLMAVALGLSAYHLGALLFEAVEHLFPLPGETDRFGEATRWPVSILVVAVPVFVWVSRVIARDVRDDPGKRQSRNRSQSVFLILFVCATVVIGVLAGVVYTFLGGDLTVRFILKSAVAIGIAGAIFGWYLRDVRPEPEGA